MSKNNDSPRRISLAITFALFFYTIECENFARSKESGGGKFIDTMSKFNQKLIHK